MTGKLDHQTFMRRPFNCVERLSSYFPCIVMTDRHAWKRSREWRGNVRAPVRQTHLRV